MESDLHEKLAYRLTQILLMLNQGDKLNPDDLAHEFSVSRRTIQRDLLERFSFLPLEKTDGQFSLDPAYLGRLTYRDVTRFASLAGIQGMFPALSADFFREMLDSRVQETLIVQSVQYENIRDRIGDFRLLQSAIQQKRTINFSYRKPEGIKAVAGACPYKLIHHGGIWYLAAVDQEKLKAYTFSKISDINVQAITYTPESSLISLLEQEDSIWLNEKKTEVLLKVAPEVADYFRRRPLISCQVIEKELETGELIISGKFAHPNQILPIVRYWLPHVRIISPESWQEDLEAELKTYLAH